MTPKIPKNLQQLREELEQKSDVNALVNGERTKIGARMQDVPVRQMMDAIQYLEKNLMPAVRKKTGSDQSPDYLFFKELVDFLLWAVVLADRYQSLETRLMGARLMEQLLREQLTFYERELTRYTTMEDLLLSQTMDHYAKNVAAAAADRLKSRDAM